MISLVQNEDDQGSANGARHSRKRGSRLFPVPASISRALSRCPNRPVRQQCFAFAGRLLDDKGIRTLVAAHRLLRARGSNVQLLIAGTPDPANPASVSPQKWCHGTTSPGSTGSDRSTILVVFGHALTSLLCSSRREGLPLSLLEAAACGRAMVATDVPGCREAAIPG